MEMSPQEKGIVVLHSIDLLVTVTLEYSRVKKEYKYIIIYLLWI